MLIVTAKNFPVQLLL